jgi:zinc protease
VVGVHPAVGAVFPLVIFSLSKSMEPSRLLADISETILENGLKVICLKKSQTPVVSVQVWYKTGSANEKIGIRGISHFFEHMMFRGSKNVGPQEHARRINDVGGHYNAFTAEDVTGYLNSVPTEYLDMVFDLEADRMTNLTINETVLETERNVIIEEYQTYMNNPLTKAFLEFRKEFFNGHPYTYSALGRLEDIQSIGVDDCLDYYRKWYTPSNAVIVVVGDIDDCDDVFSRVRERYGSIESRPVPAQKATASQGAGSPAAWMKRNVDFDVPVCIIGYPAPAASNSDAVPLEIMQLVMSQGESSRLNREVVRKQSIAVMAGGMNQCLKLAGMSLFFAVFTPDVSERRVEEALIKQIRSVAANGISEAEMEKVRNTVLTNRVFELYSAEHICQKIGYSETIEGDYRFWVQRLSILETMTVDMMKSAAQRYWDDSMRHTLYLKPKKANYMMYAAGMLRRIFPHKS